MVLQFELFKKTSYSFMCNTHTHTPISIYSVDMVEIDIAPFTEIYVRTQRRIAHSYENFFCTTTYGCDL